MKNAQSVRFNNALTNSLPNDPKDRDSSAHAEQNPILNALFSTDPVIEGFETLEDWNEHRDTVVQGLNPVGKLETLHAERAAMYLWRLDRVIRFEKIATQFDHDEVFAEFIVALDNKDIPRDRSEAATVEKVRKPLRDYLDAYMKLGAQAAKLPEIKEGLDRVRDSAKRVRERRLLPDQSTVQTIIKYESHLDRCLARTTTELRRLQNERRQGLREVDEFDETPGRSAPHRTVKDMPVSKDLNGRANLPVSRLIDADHESDDPRLVTAYSPSKNPIKLKKEVEEVPRSVPGLIVQNSNTFENGSSGSPSQAISISQQSNIYEDGSPGGSPSHFDSPSHFGSISQTGSHYKQSNIYESGSPGGSPSHFDSPSHFGSISQTSSILQQSNIYEDGSPGGSPSHFGSPSQTGSHYKQSNIYESGSPGGSPSHFDSPSHFGSISQASSISQQSNIYEDGSPGGSPSHFDSPSHFGSPSHFSSISQTGSTSHLRSPTRTGSHSQTVSTLEDEANANFSAVANVGVRTDPIALDTHIHQRE
jgi:hypothetical protein